jgi:O-antigen/teichoic acid export membrane protein
MYYAFFNIDWSLLKLLVLTGLPIMADIVLPITMSNVDRIMIAAMLTPEILGIYSIGSAGVTILGMIPSALGQMLFVKFAEMHGQNRNNDQVADIMEKTTLVLSSLFAPVLSLGIVLFPVIVIVLLPEYVSGIAAGRLLIASVFFFAVSLPATKWCVSTGHYVSVLTLRFIFAMVEFALVYVTIRSGGSLQSIALVMLVALAAFSGAISVICYRILSKPLLTGVVKTCKGILPFFIILGVIVAQDLTQGTATYLVGFQLIGSSTAALIIGSLLSTPFIY